MHNTVGADVAWIVTKHMHALVEGCEVHASDVIWVFGVDIKPKKRSLTVDTLFIWTDVNISRSKS